MSMADQIAMGRKRIMVVDGPAIARGPITPMQECEPVAFVANGRAALSALPLDALAPYVSRYFRRGAR